MNNELRDRIAKALFRNGFENLKWEDESEELREALRGEADAVIAELRAGYAIVELPEPDDPCATARLIYREDEL